MKKLFELTRSMFLFYMFVITTFAQGQIVELKFNNYPETGSDTSKVLQSIVKARNNGEQYAIGGLFLLTYAGDFNELFQKENQKAIDFPLINETWRYCSVFSTRNNNSIIMGRNWDNQNVGSIIAVLYKPSRGYSSISFTRAIDMGFTINMDLERMKSNPLGGRLLLAPFYAYDGLNEHGLCVAVLGVDQVTVHPVQGRELIFVSYLVRKILDQTKSVDEAVKFVENYIPFDLKINSLNSHLYIADSSGRSIILEYRQDEWKKTYSKKSWQVMTNNVIYDSPDAVLKEKCWRFKSISETLEKTNGKVDWRAGMQILRDVSQKGTTWSVVYSPTSKDIYFSVYQSWDKIYHIQGF